MIEPLVRLIAVISSLNLAVWSGTSVPSARQDFASAAGRTTLQFARLLGHKSTQAAGIAVDDSGNIYLAVQQRRDKRTLMVPSFVEKLDPSGRKVLYRTEVPATLEGIAVDGKGNAYVAGIFGNSYPDVNFLTPGSFQPRPKGRLNAVIARLDPRGHVVYATALGGGMDDLARAIAVDRAGDVYVTGSARSPDFPLVTPIQPVTRCLSTDNDYGAPFVAELDPKGKHLIYSTIIGGCGWGGMGEGIALDGAGSAYIGGFTIDPGFPTTPGAVQSTEHTRNGSAFVAKIAPGGSRLIYSTYLGGSKSARSAVLGIAVGARGSAYVAGYAGPRDLPQAHVFERSLTGDPEVAFVARLDPAASHALFSDFLGGNGSVFGSDLGGLALDQHGDAYLVGATLDPHFPVHRAIQSRLGTGICPMYINDRQTRCAAMFISEVNPAGNALVFSTFLGGRTGGSAQSIAVKRGEIYVGGGAGGGFPGTPPRANPNLLQAVVAKIGVGGS